MSTSCAVESKALKVEGPPKLLRGAPEPMPARCCAGRQARWRGPAASEHPLGDPGTDFRFHGGKTAQNRPPVFAISPLCARAVILC
jgi:hypothetical protein